MGCKDTVLPDPLLKKHSFKSLKFEENTQETYNDNLSLIRALALHLHGNKRLEEETSKLIYSSKKLVGLIQQAIQVFAWKILQQWRILFRQIISCTILTFSTDLWLGSLRGQVSIKILILYDYYVVIVTFAMSPMSTLSWKPLVHRVMNASIELQTWSDFWLLAKKELNMFFRSMPLICEKHYLTYLTRSIFLTPITKNSLKTWQNLLLNRFLCSKASSSIPIVQQRLASTFLCLTNSSNLIDQPIFLCHCHSPALVESFVDARNGLATQSKAQMKWKFLKIGTSVMSKHNQNFSALNQYLVIWSDIFLLTKKELNTFCQRMCFNCEKYCLTN